MTVQSPMRCPKCGEAMNHHADKLVHATDSEGLDPMFGGVVLETHGCPTCGHIESRPAPRLS